jgi:hypothetical protein
MAALLLSAAGAAAGGALFGPIGAIAGRIAGAIGGNMIDRALFTDDRMIEGPRLSDLELMASTEGAPIPRAYGRVRIAGQVIWATALEEAVNTSQTGGGKGGGGGSVSTTTYSYFANFAVGLCEGRIGQVLRVWADGKPLDLTGMTWRLHDGSETQAADPLIVAKEGVAPAYRGLAYIVFERLPLANFGNRIPQLSFEVMRPVGALENMVRAVTLIPGSTEFGYEPATVVRVLGAGEYGAENRHVAHAPSDVVASLDELQATCRRLERVAVVVAWFGSDLRAGHCEIKPKVDSLIKVTQDVEWAVDGLTRDAAEQVSTVGGRAAYGGTPSDQSVIDLIAELKGRGLKVTLYPFVMMDIPHGNALPNPHGPGFQPAYPWRGRITCDPAPGQPGSPDGTMAALDQVSAFFNGGDWNYRRMVLHYAAIAAQAGGVDAFVIGSELPGLTRVRQASGIYPAVNRLTTLAADVRAVVSASTLITYAADWTEYGAHVVSPSADEVRFPLDRLWGSSAIDAVGIDYYAPLSDWRDGTTHLDRAIADNIYDSDYLAGNLKGGEGYDWYYRDDAARATQSRTPITDGLGKPWVFRAKDIWNWWSRPHFERTGGAELGARTEWIPQSKPIWFTEVGCPAVDKGPNQPSVFPDPKSSENFVPYFSTGRRDDLAQRRMLEAVLASFDPVFGATDAFNPVSTVYGGRMLPADGIHLWTWDARPYPVFPAAADVWGDAANWDTGHWFNGRLGSAPLDALVKTMLADCGIGGVSTAALIDAVDGYLIDRPMSPRAMIDPLALTYAFDAGETGGTLRFVRRGGAPIAELDEDALVLAENSPPLQVTRTQETELPREVSIGYGDLDADYRRAAIMSRRLVGGSARVSHADVPVVTNDAAARRRADIWLQDLWAGRERASFALPPSALRLGVGDVIGLTGNGRRQLFEIDEITDAQGRMVTARSIDPDIFEAALPKARRRRKPRVPAPLGPVNALALDLPALDETEPPALAQLAVFAAPWPGAINVWSSADGSSFVRAATALTRATIGDTLTDLPAGPVSRWDRHNVLTVRLSGGSLTSLTDLLVLSGRNAAAVQRPDGAC